MNVQPQGQPQGQPQAQDQGLGGWFSFLSRSFLLWMLFNTFMAPKQNQQQKGDGQVTETPNPLHQMLGVNPRANIPKFAIRDSEGLPYGPHQCIWRSDTIMDLYVFLTEHESFDMPTDADKEIWSQQGITLGWKDKAERKMETNVTVTPHMYNNGSVYAHVFFAVEGYPIHASAAEYDARMVAYKSFEMTKYRLRKKPKKLRNLVAAGTEPVESDVNAEVFENDTSNEPIIKLYWKPTLELQIVLDMPTFARNSIPPQISQYMTFHESGQYYPLIYHNEFWLLSKSLMEINETVTSVPLKISYAHVGFFIWHMQNTLMEQWSMQQSMGTGTEAGTDMLRETIAETNPWLLGITVVVSLLHMVFDFLAFKNDISFWRHKKSMEGLSVRTIFVNVVFQLIILLYLFDNDTSWMILISSSVGFVIECWKITKAIQINVQRAPGAFLPSVSFSSVQSYNANRTREYDEIATTHLLYVVVPLVLGYATYSLLHSRHKGWYSWVVTSLTGFVYAFGFVTMTPQLFINYKLKSVAHMPWKSMVYKALNTFIDDLFAFIIKMPLLHRIGCLRDDVIFFIYLYQRWIYPVDVTRTNEFGQVAEEAKSLVEGDSAVSAAVQSIGDAQQSNMSDID